jgi:cytochrome c553
MTRLIVFGAFCLSLVLALNLGSFRVEKTSTERFDFEKARIAHETKVAEIAHLTSPKVEVVEAEVKVAAGPLVELTSDELKRGHDLYKKCISCHGVSGEGKKSQNAPKIGGQYDWYTELQITNIQSKVRINKVMDPFVKALSAQDIKDLALYISKLPWKK